MTDQPRDESGFLVIEGARINHYLGTSNGVDRYVLEVPEGTSHQSGPYEMRRTR